ncbi:hypothetical protein TSAR_015738 [Trichomalopsis sarcophagae]|uniref:Uncharacterized protein n=1 Tax=Trichomalopsis sarcophagae TaxID=543379 RepID=A0A232EI17_9HYME|nr:hypothetical protein TSAR_015738 [Trichomalopsis sarcophagae]
MSSAPVRGIVPQRQRRHHHHHHHHHEKHQRRHSSQQECPVNNNKLPAQRSEKSVDSSEEKRPKVNPIFLWAAQREQRIVEVRCEDYDKRNRIKLTKTPQGWRSIPRTALTAYSTTESVTEDEGEQQENLSTTTKNEEKENNSSRERVEIKPAGAEEDTRVNDASQLQGKADESEEDRERHKRKRKKHGELHGKSKRRKTDSEPELPEPASSSEALVSTSWKMKKRRKFDKNKKRKRLCLEEDVIGKNGKLDDASEVRIKQESKREVEGIAEAIDTTENATEFKMEIRKADKSSEEQQKKCDNLEKLQNNRCLQPRVVLEQLHLSQLPTRVHRRLANRAEQTNNAEPNEGRNNADEMVEDNVENSSHVNNESRINPPDNEEADVVDKEDLQEILNMLDSSHFPISVNETKSSLIGGKDLPRSCTKLGVAVLSNHQSDEIAMNDSPMKECAKRENEMTASEKRSKFGERLNVKHRVGSKSLDETIERLERSINWQKKLGSLPNISSMEDDDAAKQKASTLESEINDKKYGRQNALHTPAGIVRQDAYEEQKTNKDMIESTKILDALRNTPGLSISLATNGRKHNALIDATTNLSKIMSCSRSPDSQAEVAEKVSKSLPGLSIAVPVHPLRPKTASPALKNRVESPESTVDFSKQEQCPCETNEEDGNCHSQAVEETKSQSIFKRHTSKCSRQAHGDYQTYYDDGKDYSMHPSKMPNLKPIVPVVSRNSEAQAKYSNLPRYQESEDYDEHMLEDFNSQVSPQPSGIPYSMSSSRRSSSAYLERLLPSPPCSVSCSEDAKNDLTLKSILSTSSNIDSRNLDSRRDQPMDLNTHCDSEISPSYDHTDERFSKDPKSDCSHLQQKANYLEMRNRRRPMSSGDVHSPFAADYVSPKRPMSAEWTTNQQRMQSVNGCYPNNIRYANQKEFVSQAKVQEVYSVPPTIFLDPASQLRQLIKTSGHLIPDPLLVPRDYLPLLAGAPLTEIPKLLATRPELRLPEALTRPELLRDPDLLVISLAHLQHVLDHGEGPVSQTHNPIPPMPSPSSNEGKSVEQAAAVVEKNEEHRPKLSCKPIGKLMPAPMDLSSNHKVNAHPPLLRVRSGLLKQEPEVSSTASSPDDSHLWHPLFGR